MFKLIVIGNSGVGKSCLVLQFIDKKARKNHDITIGVEFGAKVIKIQEKSLKLQIWDTAGQETFRSISRSYYRSAAGALLVYDVTDIESFNALEEWIEEINQHANEQITLILVANKSDLKENRQVSTEQGSNFAKQNNMLFIETSAISSQNVNEAFIVCSEAILQKILTNKLNLEDENCGVKLGHQNNKVEKSEQQKNKCC